MIDWSPVFSDMSQKSGVWPVAPTSMAYGSGKSPAGRELRSVRKKALPSIPPPTSDLWGTRDFPFFREVTGEPVEFSVN
jgi:hypothetical protein